MHFSEIGQLGQAYRDNEPWRARYVYVKYMMREG